MFLLGEYLYLVLLYWIFGGGKKLIRDFGKYRFWGFRNLEYLGLLF